MITLLTAYSIAFGLNFFFHADLNDNFRKIMISVPHVVYTVILFSLFQI